MDNRAEFVGSWSAEEQQLVQAVLDRHTDPAPGYNTWRLVANADGITYSARRLTWTYPPMVAASAQELAERLERYYLSFD